MKKSLLLLTIFVCGSTAFDAFAKDEKKKTMLERDIILLYKSAKWSALDLPKHLYKGGVAAIKSLPEVAKLTAKGGKVVVKRGAKEVREFSAMSKNVTLYPVIISVNLAKRIKVINKEMVLELFDQIEKTIKNMNREQLLKATNMPYEVFRDNFLRALVYGPLIAAKYGLVASSLILFSPFLYFYWYMLARDVLYKIDLKVAMGDLKRYSFELSDRLQGYVAALSTYLNTKNVPEAERQKYTAILEKMKNRLDGLTERVTYFWKENKNPSLSFMESMLRPALWGLRIKDLVSNDPSLQKILGYSAALEEKRIEIPLGFGGGYGRKLFWPLQKSEDPWYPKNFEDSWYLRIPRTN